ncbi:hypothetical protein F5B20DRAFT_579503 [Whalleya microplaca]|nr:hypothetical protein F5B20DRAFT_579503 [Whalleya microplaca]
MASLRFIIDTEDEDDAPQVNKSHGDSIQPSPSRSHDPSRTASSSHANPREQDDRLAPASTRRRGHSSRSTKSTTTATSSAPSTPRPAPVRRQSTTSNESMDPSGYGGYAPSPSSGSMAPSNMPTRPMGNAPGESNVPVRLTPITGRVSRAKKGVPVHTCETCKPPKTFTRAEHLSDQDEKASPMESIGRSPGEGSTGMGDYMPASFPPSMSGQIASSSGMTSNTSYPSNTSSYPPLANPSSSSGQTPMSPPRHPHESYDSPTSGHHDNYTLSSQQILLSNQTPSLGGSPASGTHFRLQSQPPRTSPPFSVYMGTQMLPHDLPSLTIPDNNVPGLLEGTPWASSASTDSYSAPSDIGHNHSHTPRRTVTQRYESPDWRGSNLYPSSVHQGLHGSETGLDIMTSAAPYFGPQFTPSPHHYDPAMDLPMFPDDHNLIDHTHNYDPYSSVRSPTPPTISLSAQSAEHLVTVAAPPSISDAQSMGGRHKESAVLWGSHPDAAFLAAINLPQPVRNAIPKYLDVYWKRFDTLYPLVHRKSFETAASEVLRCAMAAVGTQFLQSKEDRIQGNYLHEFARDEVKRCPQWNVQIMQAILLCDFYARFCGRSVVRNPSQAFQSLYSRDHLFSSVFPSSHNDLWHPYSTSSSSQMADIQTPDDFISTASTREEQWIEWINTETYRRLLSACFILDVHTSVYYQQHLTKQFSITKTPIFLTRPSEDLWNARSSDAWEDVKASKATMEPSMLSDETLTLERIATAPPLDLAIFLASEALRLPKRSSSPSVLDLSAEVDQARADRISSLFPGSAIGNTYLALHYTPLHDLLAVSGETFLFTKKLASPQTFQQHKRGLQQWSGSTHAGVAAGFAAKALLAFVETGDYTNSNPLNTTEPSAHINNNENDRQRTGNFWNMSDISDWWAMYVCALICWALGHRTTRGAAAAARATNSGTGSASSRQNQHNHNHDNANEEREARKWLKTVAGLPAEEVVNLRGQRQAMAVVGMVRRRLEDKAVGSLSRLLIDALRTLKQLEERPHHKWF